MPRGGRRSGTPGAQYGNRSDLQQGPRPMPPTAAPGQTYGVAAAQVRAQQAVPVGPTPTPTVPAAPSPAAPTGTAPIIPLDAPTMRPNEPVTAGSPSGPGPGPAPPTTLGPASPLVAAAAALSAIPDVELDADTRRMLALIHASLGNQAAV